MTGFEPATSCSQSRRATKLRYIPLYLSHLARIAQFDLIIIQTLLRASKFLQNLAQKSKLGISCKTPIPKSVPLIDLTSNKANMSFTLGFPRLTPVAPIAIINPQYP